ncbi:MAG: hypothetical protein M4579_004337 [Chaenotheca gracillima]|nr:MAG: hypothetical protein M4579_004337 [Chaenotheca gracillima]
MTAAIAMSHFQQEPHEHATFQPASKMSSTRLNFAEDEEDESNHRGASPVPRIYPGGSTFDLAMFLRDTSPPPKIVESQPARTSSVKASPLSFFRSGRHKAALALNSSKAQLPSTIVAKTAVNGKKYMQITIPGSVQDDLHLHRQITDLQRPFDSAYEASPRKSLDSIQNDDRDLISNIGHRRVEIPPRKAVNEAHVRPYNGVPQLSLTSRVPEAASRRQSHDSKHASDEFLPKRAGRAPRKQSKLSDGSIARPSTAPERDGKEHDRLLSTIPTTPDRLAKRAGADVPPSTRAFSPSTGEQPSGSPDKSSFSSTRTTSQNGEGSREASVSGKLDPSPFSNPPSPDKAVSGDIPTPHRQGTRTHRESRRGFVARPPPPGPAPTKALPSLPELHTDVSRPRPSMDWYEGFDQQRQRSLSARRNGSNATITTPTRDVKPFKIPAANLDGMTRTIMKTEASPTESPTNIRAFPLMAVQSTQNGIESAWKPFKEDSGMLKPHKNDFTDFDEPRALSGSPRSATTMKRNSRVSVTASDRSSKRSSSNPGKRGDSNNFSQIMLVVDQDPTTGKHRSNEILPASTEQHRVCDGSRSSSSECDSSVDARRQQNLVLPSSDDEYGGNKVAWRKTTNSTTSGGTRSSVRSSRTMTSQAEIESRLGALERRNALLEAALVSLLQAPATHAVPEVSSLPLGELKECVEKEKNGHQRQSSFEVLISSLAT